MKGALDLLVVFVGYSEIADCPTPRSSPRATPDHTVDSSNSTSRKFKDAVETVSSKKGMAIILFVCTHGNVHAFGNFPYATLHHKGFA